MENFTIKYKATFLTEVSVDAETYDDAVSKVVAMELPHFLYSAEGLRNPEWWNVEEYDNYDSEYMEYDTEILEAVSFYYGYAEAGSCGTSPSDMLEHLLNRRIPKEIALYVIQREFDLDDEELKEYE